MGKLKRTDLLSEGFYHKSRFTGSIGLLSFILEKKEEEERPTYLLATYWEGPFSSENTPDEKKSFREEEFSEEGFEKITDFLNEEADKINSVLH